jgi:predicted nucleic acid-binding protein
MRYPEELLDSAISLLRVTPQTPQTQANLRRAVSSAYYFMGGFEMYRARPDKGYSLTDCISMQTMRREGLTEVLTNDRHFEQEGFRALVR